MVKLDGEQFQIKSARADARLRAYPPSCLWPVSRSRLACCRLAPPVQRTAAESYAIAMHGAPALPADFTRICPTPIPMPRRAAGWSGGMLGTFDSLNPLIVSGVAVQQIRGSSKGWCREPDGARQ